MMGLVIFPPLCIAHIWFGWKCAPQWCAAESECIILWDTDIPRPRLIPLVAIPTHNPQHAELSYPELFWPPDDEKAPEPSTFILSPLSSHSHTATPSEPPTFTSSTVPIPPLLYFSVPSLPFPSTVGTSYYSGTGLTSCCYCIQLCVPGKVRPLWIPLDPSSHWWPP